MFTIGDMVSWCTICGRELNRHGACINLFCQQQAAKMPEGRGYVSEVDHEAGRVTVSAGREVDAELWHGALATGTATITPDMAFRDAWAAAKAAREARNDQFDRHAELYAPRTTPARPLRVRVCTDRVDGPAWLTLLCQCAWLRGGIVGSAGLPAEG